MRLEDLKGMSREEQSRLIGAQKKVATADVIDNPDLMNGNILVFRGNYAGFDTKGLCVRTLEYLREKDKWKISDIDLLDGFCEEYDKCFEAYEVLKNFKGLYNSKGFLLEK